eukprot:Colp12_sorted_trinity150504_noHs@9688
MMAELETHQEEPSPMDSDMASEDENQVKVKSEESSSREEQARQAPTTTSKRRGRGPAKPKDPNKSPASRKRKPNARILIPDARVPSGSFYMMPISPMSPVPVPLAPMPPMYHMPTSPLPQNAPVAPPPVQSPLDGLSALALAAEAASERDKNMNSSHMPMPTSPHTRREQLQPYPSSPRMQHDEYYMRTLQTKAMLNQTPRDYSRPYPHPAYHIHTSIDRTRYETPGYQIRPGYSAPASPVGLDRQVKVNQFQAPPPDLDQHFARSLELYRIKHQQQNTTIGTTSQQQSAVGVTGPPPAPSSNQNIERRMSTSMSVPNLPLPTNPSPHPMAKAAS